ncbi:hypothetical protein CO661_00330 [Sinorhizobium fredii]|uniref:Uncharacterized protein n=1 Tax=Rhizobium fredii TaxID=380 RepID=A0A2A6M6G8_RHIFR|nr:hypothetical protein CO661_00330 [Sinorhizobium fredii]
MVYDWDGRRTRRIQMLRFIGALAIPALLLGSAIAAVEWTHSSTSTLQSKGGRY